MEIAYIEAATCGACFSLEVIFLGDTALLFRAGSASISLSVGFEKIENFKCFFFVCFRERLSLFVCMSRISAVGKKKLRTLIFNST